MKWKFSDLKIRTKMLIGFLCVLILSMSLGGIGYVYITDIAQHSIPIILKNNETFEHILGMRKNEKDFLLLDKTNLEFFKTGKSEQLNKFEENYQEVIKNIESLRKHEDLIGNKEIIEDLDKTIVLIQQYHDTFLKVTDKVKTRGFKDYGSIGEMRNSIHHVEDALKNIQGNKDLHILMLEARRTEKDYLLRNDVKYVDQFNTILSKMKLLVNASSISEKNKLTSLVDQYRGDFNKVVSIDQEIGLSNTEGLTGQYRNTVHSLEPLLKEVNEDIKGLIGNQVKSAARIIVTVIILTMGISLILAVFISKLITRPIDQTNDMLKDIAKGEGDLTKRLEVNSKDELGTLSKWFNLFVTKIKDMVAQVKKDANTLSESSHELAAAMEQVNQSIESIANEINTVSDGLQSNASVIEEATAGIEEIASGAVIVSKESQNVAKNSEEALKAAHYGVEKLKDVVGAIDKVKDSSNNMYIIVEELNNSSLEISEIVSMITNISEQTNLLALNAAIEAARAGDAGKGFAVVAEEVRKLAEESKNSADKITLLIHEIENKTKNAHDTMKEEQEIVDISVEKARETNEEFDKILKVIEEIADKMKTISDSSMQQSEIAEDMAKAMDEFSQTTQNSASSSQQISMEIQEQVSTFEEVSANIEALNNMAKNLKEQTDTFKVK
ncbi:methyl-accepting chemotaxis protein [Crassaminicella profunda]|uniref:methyl-accepting chemotaxis protein n=1 Tax=Crassaminicella profunda TaxID=1286698 RepID=UPI001CA6F6AF|nr:methyl-accepting chemotaxis protein [Crassaminicella profunda]QZY54437.1 methyl-accepting chemotaxis protein [Crassaminicella profunda]